LDWIRQHVGHQKIFLVFASACIRDNARRLLWQRRADFGWWGLPCSVLELAELLPECVVRKVYEETGLMVEPTRLVGVYSSPDFDVTYPNGDQVQQVTACFECRVVNGRLPGPGSEPQIPHPESTDPRTPQSRIDTTETLELAWFDLDERPPTAPWYAAMTADLALEERSASFDRGRPGNSRGGEAYFRRVRRHIGAAPFVMPAAAAFIRDQAGHVLLQRRGDTGDWGLPGGGMELGERVDQTIVNEVHEETGLEVAPTRLIGIYSDPAFWFTYPNGDRVKVVSSLFECRVLGGDLQADGIESLEVRFFPPDALPPMAERHARRVRDGLAERGETLF
jgi:ADP-ribose pyrophosphatase YjhB (NUDIX family)